MSLFIPSYTAGMEIGRYPNKLKMFRRCQGYSQKKVARMLGLADTSTLSRWEHGIALPSIMHVFRLAGMYQTLPHELFEELWDQYASGNNLLVQETEPFNTNQSFFV